MNKLSFVPKQTKINKTYLRGFTTFMTLYTTLYVHWHPIFSVRQGSKLSQLFMTKEPPFTHSI